MYQFKADISRIRPAHIYKVIGQQLRLFKNILPKYLDLNDKLISVEHFNFMFY